MVAIIRRNRQDLKLLDVAIGSQERVQVRQLREQNSREILDQKRRGYGRKVASRWILNRRGDNDGNLHRRGHRADCLHIEGCWGRRRRGTRQDSGAISAVKEAFRI